MFPSVMCKCQASIKLSMKPEKEELRKIGSKLNRWEGLGRTMIMGGVQWLHIEKSRKEEL